MDPRTTTAVVTMRIWQLRGGAKSMTFLVSNCASCLLRRGPRGSLRRLDVFLDQFQDPCDS